MALFRVRVVLVVFAALMAGLFVASGGVAGADDVDPAASDDVVMTAVDSPILVDVLENDFDDAAVGVVIASQPSDGSVDVVVTDGEESVRYSPDAGFGGVDEFVYSTCGAGGCSEASVVVYVGAGHCTVVGTPGDDVLVGGPGDDVICGFGGDDEIRGLGGDDLIFAGSGADVVDAGSGADRVFGGSGADELNGGGGRDELHGNRGRDTISGGNGNDQLFGGRGADDLSGGKGDDVLRGRGGNDVLRGNEGADRLHGGRGVDELRGGKGADKLFGGRGGDVLVGGKGADELYGRRGADSLDGGAGSDLLDGGAGTDACVNGEVLVSCEGDIELNTSFEIAQPSTGLDVGSVALVSLDVPADSDIDEFRILVDEVEVGAIDDGSVQGQADLSSVPAGPVTIVVAGFVDGVEVERRSVTVTVIGEMTLEELREGLASGAITADAALTVGFGLAMNTPAGTSNEPELVGVDEGDEESTVTVLDLLLTVWPDASAEARAAVVAMNGVSFGSEVVTVDSSVWDDTSAPASLRSLASTVPLPSPTETQYDCRVLDWVSGLVFNSLQCEVNYEATVPGTSDVRWLVDYEELHGVAERVEDAAGNVEPPMTLDRLNEATKRLWDAELLFKERGFQLPEVHRSQGVPLTLVLIENSRQLPAYSSPFNVYDLLGAGPLPGVFNLGHAIRVRPRQLELTLVHELFHTFEWSTIDWAADVAAAENPQRTATFYESAANWGTHEFIADDPALAGQSYNSYRVRDGWLNNPEQDFLGFTGAVITPGDEAYAYFPAFEWLDEHARAGVQVSNSSIRDMIVSYGLNQFGADPLDKIRDVVAFGEYGNPGGEPLANAWPKMWTALYLLQDRDNLDAVRQAAFAPGSGYEWAVYHHSQMARVRLAFDDNDSNGVLIEPDVKDMDGYGYNRTAQISETIAVPSAGVSTSPPFSVDSGGAGFQDFTMPAASSGVARIRVSPASGTGLSDRFEAVAIQFEATEDELNVCLDGGVPRISLSDPQLTAEPIEMIVDFNPLCNKVSVGAVNVVFGAGPTDILQIQVEVLAALPELVSSLPVGMSGVAYGPEPVVVSTDGQEFDVAVTDGELPAGLSLSSAGVITGTTNGGEVAFFDVTLTDEYGQQVTAGLRLDVNGLRPPVFVDPSLPVDTPADVRLDVVPGGPSNDEIASVAVTAGALPDGLTVSKRDELQIPGEPSIPAGVNIAGTPSEVGAFTATLMVTDTAGIDTTFDVSFDVQGPVEWSSTLDCVWADDVVIVASGAVAVRSCGVHDGLYLLAEGGSGWQLTGSAGVDRRPDSLAGNGDLFYVGISGLNGRVIVYDPASGVVGSLSYPTGIGPFYRAAQIAVETSFGGSTLVAQAASAADGSALVVTWEGAENTPPQDWTVTVVDLGAGFADISQFDVELIRVALSGDGLFVVHPTTGAVTRIDLMTGASTVVSAAPTDGSRVVGIERTSDGRVLIARSTRFELVAMSGAPIATYLPQFGITSIAVGPATANTPFGTVVFTGNLPEIFQVELNADGFGSTDFVLQLDPPQRVPQSVATNGVHLVVVWGIPATFDQGVTIYRYPTN